MTRAFRLAESLAIVALSLGAASAVHAQADPPGCASTGVQLVVQAFLADGVTPAVGSMSPCAALNYQVTLAKVGGNNVCAFGSGSLTLTTPDGVVHPLVAPVPCIGGTGVAPGCSAAVQSVTSALVPYTVKPSDIHSGFVTAVANYQNGVVFDGPFPTPGVFASTPKSLAAATSCADASACTLDLCDSVTGCRHLIAPRCLVIGGLNLKLATSLGSTSFKVQDVTKDPGTPAVKVTLQQLVLTSVNDKLVKQKVKLGGVVGGADAGIGSLLYPVAALGGTGSLPIQGYDVTFTGTSQACQDTLPADVCTSLAKGLAQAIDAQLVLGDAATRDAFRQGIQALGYRPDSWCTPTTCCALNANCGSLPDGCGGTLDCGTCTAPLSCGGDGTPNHCGIIP
jgi:hypothetical protein